MKKKILIFSIFLSFFFVNPKIVIAAENDNNLIQEFLNTVVNFFQYIIKGSQYISRNYDVPATYNTKDTATDYASKLHDYGSKNTPQAVRERRIGEYFYAVLFGVKDGYDPYNLKDEVVIEGNTSTPNSEIECPHDIKIKDIVCFYKNKFNSGESQKKILYKRGEEEPQDYSQVDCKKQLENNDQCYINAYINYQDVPQGAFEGKEDTAPLTSPQFYDSNRQYTPLNRQGETAPLINDTKDNIKAIIDNTTRQQEILKLSYLDKKTQDKIMCTNFSNINWDNLDKAFACQFDEAKRGNTDCGLGPDTNPQADCGIEGEDYITNGRGISQHGAHGLALQGFKYDQIVNKYFGDNATTNTFDGKDNEEMMVILTDDLDKFNNQDNCQSYAARVSGIYNHFNIETGEGGVYENGDDCEFIKNEDPNDPTRFWYEVKPKDVTTNDEKKTLEECFSSITLVRKFYLFGIAEVPTFWHIESLKALMLAFRHDSLTRIIKSTGMQVFQCSRGIENIPENKYFQGANPATITNQRAAVELTKDELIVDKGNEGKPREDATHYTAFCGPGSSNPLFDGLPYELISRGLWGNETGDNANLDRINGICFTGINERTEDSDVLGVTSDNSNTNHYPNRQISSRSKTVNVSLKNNIYYFNDTTTKSPIKENYDLIDVDNGKWLTPFPKYTDCQLDSRVFPAITSLIEKLNQEIPNNSLVPKNCYRDFETQSALWYQGLIKYNDTYTNLMWHSYPGTSIHQTGRVVDFYEDNNRLKSSSPVYQWLVKNASNFGFYHYQIEPWHWEYNP